MTSSDKARRVWAIILFLIFGPTLFLTVLGIVYHRRGVGGVNEEQVALTELFRAPTTLTDIEFIRPGMKSYFGLRIASPQTGETFLFCPEILSRPRKPSDDADDLSVLEAEISQRFAEIPAGKPIEWLIPDLYVKLEESESLATMVRGGVTTKFRNDAMTDIRFRIGRIHLIRRIALFDQTVSDYRRPPRRFGAEMIATLSGADRGFDHERSSEGDLSGQVAEFVSNPDEMILEEGNGRFIHSKKDSLFTLEFRPKGITATDPARLTMTYANDKNFRLFWDFDCQSCPIPSTLAAPFAPLFHDCGDTSWLTGRMTSIPDSDSSRIRQIHLKDVSLQNGALASLLKKITSTRIEGRLARLTVQSGEITNGVFIGNGRIHLTKGGFHKDFLVRFQKEFALQFNPKNTLANRFPDDMIPYDQVIFDFDFLPDGVTVTASDAYPSGVAGVFESDGFRYNFFLPTEKGTIVSYQRLLSTLSDEGDRAFWTPFYRDALNHLPANP